ncbi:hypothetical protein SmJEL517_g02769 [Synchytrium microbalum]|uniref:tRNA-splicing endonuclease subunit Sen34 n=1 Tax=Synchytrium microbalum TaxID=1806994 RepID=A0A507BZI2_9FUNG|nr:uncharacterized protein SmJEL517_g02769 [Synchytrium microbalum]TPX34680.1 hypothetical protein SmJEL517_g02769 [Synchytrium microbalum]
MAADAPRPSVYLIQDRAFIWDAQSAIILRRDYRIVGALVGTLPRMPSQNWFMGLPIELSIEEVSLLVKRDVIDLVDDASCLREPTEEDMAVLEAQYQAEYQVYAAQRAKVNELRAIQGRQMAASRARTKSSEEASKATTTIPFDAEDADNGNFFAPVKTINTTPSQSDAIEGPEQQQNAAPTTPTSPSSKKPSITLPPHPISTFTSSIRLPWFKPTPLNKADIPARYTTPTVTSKIFEDLWNRGYFMSAGSKFGGKWCAYPGDPMRYHSNYVLNLLDDVGSDMKELVAGGRLGGAVKKQYVVCSWDAVNDEPVYFCVEWTGWI